MLGWPQDVDDDGDVVLHAPPGAGPNWLFVAVPDDKVVKNRIHFDFRPDDQQAEVERVIALGARHVDIGQGEQSWVVLADPEGNEFCILAREGLASPFPANPFPRERPRLHPTHPCGDGISRSLVFLEFRSYAAAAAQASS